MYATYATVFRTTIAEYLVYRLNFLLWRFRSVIVLITKYYFWVAAFESQKSILGYSESQMLTYILLSAIISGIVLASRSQDIGSEIVNGSIINYILKPMSFFQYHVVRDLADKFLNTAFVIGEVLVLYLLLKPEIFIQTHFYAYFLIVLFTIAGSLISFFINLCLSFIGFWTPEIWGPRFIFYMLIFFFSGYYFPLDILPTPVYNAILMTPFPYIFYVPTKIYLGATQQDLLIFTFGTIVWIFGTYLLARSMWKKGMKQFSFFGK